MRSIYLSLFMMVLILSCKDNENQKKDSKINNLDQLNFDLVNTGKEVGVNYKVFLSKSDLNLDIKILFEKPYISHYDEQLEFIRFLIFKNKSNLRKYTSLRFEYGIDKEKDKSYNVYDVDKTKFLKILESYDNVKYKNMVIYCLTNLEELDLYYFDEYKKVALEKYPNNISASSFFEILKGFSNKENNKQHPREESYKLIGKDTFTLYYIQSLKEGLDNKYERIFKHINKLWKINFGCRIEDNVKLFSDSGKIFLTKCPLSEE